MNIMQSLPPDDYPITGICVVADANKCPPNFELLYKSHDRKEDCDLWKDSLFKSRITRYLCVSRKFPQDGNKPNYVLADVVVQNERELPPAGYTLLEHTVDMDGRATRKKQICVKLIPRNATTDAVNELIILSRSKRALPGYTLAGEINGLLLCFKMGPVPPETQTLTEVTTPSTPSQFTAAPFSKPPPSKPSYNAPVSANKEDALYNPHTLLSGVIFHLNPHYENFDHLKNAAAPEINYRSLVDLKSEFDYPFRTEQTVLNQYPNL